jgi:hypothetical protein
MAMTGMRTVTAGLHLVERTPPERIVTEGVPSLFRRIPPRYRSEALELAHWSFGAAAGLAYGVLPERLRRHGWSGPAWGLAVWTLFEFGIAPALGVSQKERPPRERLFVAADHVLYGLVVGGRLGPESGSGERE